METHQGQDLAHKRPWLLASLAFGLTFPFATIVEAPGLVATIWKMGGVGFLIPYTLCRHHDGDFVRIAIVLALYALGDGVLEAHLIWGGAIFAIGHVAAILFYIRHPRLLIAPSQRLLAWVLLLATPTIAWFLPSDRNAALQVTLYAVIVGSMAAAAWSSNFPRYRVGTGAVLFVISDLILVGQLGPLAGWFAEGYAVWYLYYLGVFLIATGVVQTLVKRGHAAADDLEN